jgi:hypothetical protein
MMREQLQGGVGAEFSFNKLLREGVVDRVSLMMEQIKE